ncbi:DUF1080 domain-containing protein [Stieleria sp. TO1_6]|uniref:3-keto-disaccharide hydrolase n=1 Tax=Stieleria tagensis TaxID=2956795 RepID=UPI00209B8B61|nr:DUF1080 domain-containing protein [Stieleria tagensis]MCO8124813.1 DUF1080 domain-containing protein [Stieleria tagensis]
MLRRCCFSVALSLCFLGSAFAADWVSLIQHDSLEGWEKVGGDASFSIDQGVITGTTGAGKNTFLTKGNFADFVLEFEVKCDPGLNSGVQIRSHLYGAPTPQESKLDRIREKGEMFGYQCEIRGQTNGPNGCSGNFWDEGRRTKWLDDSVDAAKAQAVYKPGQWNHFRIIAQGSRIRSYVNDKPVADFTDDRDADGLIGLQVHSVKKGSGPYQVSWRNLRIKTLANGEVYQAGAAK